MSRKDKHAPKTGDVRRAPSVSLAKQGARTHSGKRSPASASRAGHDLARIAIVPAAEPNEATVPALDVYSYHADPGAADAGVSTPIGHASTGWTPGLSSTDILSRLGQYDSRDDIPYDRVRCGASSLLGAAVAQGPAALTQVIAKLKALVGRSDAKFSTHLTLEKQREKLCAIDYRWHFTPQGGQDPYPVLLEQLAWLQTILYVQSMPPKLVGIDDQGHVDDAAVQRALGMSEPDVRRGLDSLLGHSSAVPLPIGPGSDISLAALSMRFQDMKDKFLTDDKLKPGEAVILKMATPFRDGLKWLRGFHYVTLIHGPNGYQIYNPEVTFLSPDYLDFLGPSFVHLKQSLRGHHLAGADPRVSSAFGLMLGLVVEEATAPFHFDGVPQAAPAASAALVSKRSWWQ